MRAAGLIAWIGLTACGGEGALDPQGWVPVDPADDPLADQRPADPWCLGGWWVEVPFVEVDTGRCDWFSVTQPLPVRGTGRRLRGGLAWDDLVPPEGEASAEGLAVVFVGDREVFRHTQPIPSPAGFVSIDVDLPRGSRRNTPVVLHLHNHGVNHWRWLPLRVE